MLKKYNFAILITPLLLFSFGYITLLSTAGDLVRNHLVYFFTGFLFYFLFTRIDYTLYRHLWPFLYGGAIFLLLLTFVFAELKLGAARWLQIGPLSFQTSEYAKLALVISLAHFISSWQEELNEVKNLLKLMILIAPVIIIVFIQPDLGTTAVIASTAFFMIIFGGLSKFYLLLGIFFAGVLSTPLWNILQEYQKRRILVFLNPQLDVLGSGYNVIQSLIAVGSGGLWGKGFGRGTQANLEFLPAYWTDFIFASFAEEWGFVGVFLLLSFFTILLLTILHLAYRTEDSFGRNIAIGIFFIFLLQFVINVGMNLGIMPVTGVTLPFISYGGTSMVFSFMSLGILQNIWQKNMASGKF